MKHLTILLFFFLFMSCNSDENPTDLLPNATVNTYIDLNLPSNHDLLIPGKSIETQPGAEAGIKGLIILNTGTAFLAFERACPHISLQNCGVMTVDYPFMVCPCDDEKFSILDGAPQNGDIPYIARNYNITKSGNILHITN